MSAFNRTNRMPNVLMMPKIIPLTRKQQIMTTQAWKKQVEVQVRCVSCQLSPEILHPAVPPPPPPASPRFCPVSRGCPAVPSRGWTALPASRRSSVVRCEVSKYQAAAWNKLAFLPRTAPHSAPHPAPRPAALAKQIDRFWPDIKIKPLILDTAQLTKYKRCKCTKYKTYFLI